MKQVEQSERRDYKRIKTLIHTTPLLDEDLLLKEIECFGQQYANKTLYKSLKRKFKWHRRIFPQQFPIGHAKEIWLESQKPLVSVIVPNYCHAPFLKERIECILNQTFQNFELILLDDCSTDGSKEIILSYQNHPKVSHVVINEKNTGNTFLQWERGVALAKGKYIWIAESDDYADETFLDCMMAVYSLHEDCVMVRSGSYQVNEKGRVLVRDWDKWKEDETVHFYDGLTYIKHNLLHFNFIYNASMVVFRKDVFLRIDKSYQKLRYTGDWQCWIEFLLEGPICEYRRKLNYFRQHEKKVSVLSNKTNRGIIDQINVMAYAFPKVKLSLFRKMLIRGELYGILKNLLPMICQEKDDFTNALYKNLHATKTDYIIYKIIKVFDFLPFIPSEKNDKLK